MSRTESIAVSATHGSDLTIADPLATTALAFPERTRAVIAEIEHPEDAQKALAGADALVNLAKRLKADTEAVNAIQHGRLLLIGKLGALMPRGEPGRGKKTPVPGIGFSNPKTVAIYRKLADHADRIDDYVAKVTEANAEGDCIEVTVKGFLGYIGAGGVIVTRHAAGNSLIEWYTPREHIEKVHKVMGGIDLDPASSELAQKTVNAKRFDTKDDDGLGHEWSGRVFLNPPYRMPDVARFVGKLCDEVEAGNVSQAVLLTNNCTDTDWWQRAVRCASVVCLTDGRIAFYNAAGVGSAPTNGQSFFYFGDRVQQFLDVFQDVGACLLDAAKAA